MARRKRKKRKSFIGQFFKIVISMVLIFVVFAGASIFAYTKISGPGTSQSEEAGTKTGGNRVSLLDSLTGKGITLNVAVMGVDKEETRTDVLFVVHFDS